MKYGNFEVYIDSSAVGAAEVVCDGLLTRIKCEVDYESDKVLRLAADVGDRYETIGVMMPRGKGFALEKCFTRNDIERKNLENAARYVLVSENAVYERKEECEESDERVWVKCDDPAALFEDRELGAAISRCGAVLKAECDGFTYIAVPAERENPFPALPIFYFGQREKLGGREFLVFTLKDGQLVI